MTVGARASDERKLGVLLRRQVRVLIVLLENGAHMLPLFRRIECTRRDIVQLNRIAVQLPGNEKDLAEAV